MIRDNHFNLFAGKSRETVAQRRVQSTHDVNPTYFLQFTDAMLCFWKKKKKISTKLSNKSA